MRKVILFTLITISLVLVGCIQLTPTGNQNSNQPMVNQNQNVNQPIVTQLQDYYRYCKPDEDPDFKLTKEDELYYYYTGNKSIRGVVYQQSPDSPVTFDTHVGGACKFELTKNYAPSPEIIKKDFDIDDAWKNQSNCINPDEKPSFLQGVYTIYVKGFKISKSYIGQYDPNHILDNIQMSRYSFYLDYDKIEKADEKSQIKCPTIVP